jgi:hypothetical protein
VCFDGLIEHLQILSKILQCRALVTHLDRNHRIASPGERHFDANNCGFLRAAELMARFNANSGGPLFTNSDGVLKLAAVMLGRMEPRVSIALPISEWIELTRNTDCP